MKEFTSIRLLLLSVRIAVLVLPGFPQASTGTLSGTVRDETSAVIPTATVKLTNQATNGTQKPPPREPAFICLRISFQGRTC